MEADWYNTKSSVSTIGDQLEVRHATFLDLIANIIGTGLPSSYHSIPECYVLCPCLLELKRPVARIHNFLYQSNSMSWSKCRPFGGLAHKYGGSVNLFIIYPKRCSSGLRGVC